MVLLPRACMRSRGNVIRVGTYICVQKNISERLVEALSRIYKLMTSLKSSEALSTLDNPALSTTLSIKAH